MGSNLSRRRRVRNLRRPGSGQRLVLACTLALALGGCSDTARIKELGGDSVILCFGDSLTSGKGAEAEAAYPAVLSRQLGCRVINAGRAGELSASGLERLPGELEKYKPDLVILCHGGNDMLQQHDPADIARNLDAMIRMARESGADVILIGVPKPGIFLGTAGFYEELARQHGIPYDGETVADILADGTLKSDYVHPNAAGYRRLAESLAALIAKSQVT